jgi:glyoxylase-like metal-dependent hydrolase (beta-lactamase superfamily II)
MTPDAALDLGGCRVTLVSGGGLALDGGAMFGIIPKPLWSRRTPADEQNRIRLACNCLLVEWEGSDRRVIIETGHGSKYGPKEAGMYAIHVGRWLLPALVALGVAPESITDVILSHLHFDHAGGLTAGRAEWDAIVHGAGGPPAAAGDPRSPAELVATFPRATVHAQRREFEDARANFGIMTVTYREENFAPLDAAGCWRLLDGPGEVIPAPTPGGAAIHCIMTPGHTRGHHSLVVAGRARTLCFPGDVVPTRHHVGAAWNMAYDLLPLENRASKLSLLTAAAQGEWLLAIDHEPETPLVAVAREGEWFRLEPRAGA